MDDDALRACFDGRGRVEMRVDDATVAARAGQIAHALGYRRLSRRRSRHVGLRPPD
ncbi:hypothetical protein [Streptomyces bungoensis]|uniref:hypothetical protein n=1 Tax=Streptomyces bungoensis TaxID=285568 RepID=UPI00340B30D9